MWQSVEVSGKRCDWYEPAGADGSCVLFLHGWDEGETLAGQPEATAALEQHGLRAVCPWGDKSWWLDRRCDAFDERMSPEAFLLEAVMPAVEARWQVKPPKIALLGIGMGGQGVLRLCFRKARQFPVTAAVLPAIDFHLLYGHGTTLDAMFENREAARQETAILHVHPLSRPRHLFFAADPADELWFDGARRLHEKLAAVGVPHECDLETSGQGDVTSYLTGILPRAIAFLAESWSEDELLPSS